jgi:hypothetical protein
LFTHTILRRRKDRTIRQKYEKSTEFKLKPGAEALSSRPERAKKGRKPGIQSLPASCLTLLNYFKQGSIPP